MLIRARLRSGALARNTGLHTTNIRQFAEASDSSSSSLLQAYLGLVAIELVLKAFVPLTNHDVCSGLVRYKNKYCVGAQQNKAMSLTAVTSRLRNDIQAICVNDRDGLPRYSPAESYPFLRYVRLDADGWFPPACKPEELTRLARTVQQARSLLRKNFRLPL